MVTSSHDVPPKLLTLYEVASTCGVSIRTVLRAIAEKRPEKRLVCHRLGRATRVSMDDLRAWLATRRDLRPGRVHQ
jgi:excisionase family DNA binding protein